MGSAQASMSAVKCDMCSVGTYASEEGKTECHRCQRGRGNEMLKHNPDKESKNTIIDHKKDFEHTVLRKAWLAQLERPHEGNSECPI